MLKKIGCWLAFGVLIVGLLAPLAYAQDEVKYRKKTVIDFEDVLLEGELKKPAGAYITERRELNFKNLIKVRTNFEQEMVKSVDVLK